MAFQDRVEDATAQGVLMPAWFSRLFIWRPARLERGRIPRKLAAAVQEVWEGGAPVGAWLDVVRSLKSRREIPAWRQLLHRRPDLDLAARAPGTGEAIAPEEAAEL